jgi:hypothetical protein
VPDPPAKRTVFVSHISDETTIAQWLKTKLDRDFLGGLEIFVSSDRSTISAGRRWLDEVHHALKKADLQIVLCSRASVGRPWVNFEAGAVWLRDIPVVPACHSGLEPDELPVPLNMLEGIVLSNAKGLAKLYDSVAAALGLRTPNVDFDALASEARDLEAQVARQTAGLETIRNPRVLCAATAQYAQPAFEFHRDVAVVQRYFPRAVIERALTASGLRNMLLSQRFDIVHLVLPVSSATGQLIFDPVTDKTDTSSLSTMSPAAFASLLRESRTQLVVLATCNALLLAVEVAPVANMAASDQDIVGKDAEEWADCFYGLLAQGRSVFNAFDITRQQMNAPIRAIRQKDVVFELGRGD